MSGSTPHPPDEVPARRQVNAVGLVITVLGAAGVTVAFVALSWFHSTGSLLPDSTHDPTFGDLHRYLHKAKTLADSSGAATYVHFGVSPYYFSWLGWALLIASFLTAVLAALPPVAVTWWVRALAAGVAIAGAALTLWALDLVRLDARLADQLGASGAPTYRDYLRHSGIGAWTAVAGFVLIGLGAMAGPRNAPATPGPPRR